MSLHASFNRSGFNRALYNVPKRAVVYLAGVNDSVNVNAEVAPYIVSYHMADVMMGFLVSADPNGLFSLTEQVMVELETSAQVRVKQAGRISATVNLDSSLKPVKITPAFLEASAAFDSGVRAGLMCYPGVNSIFTFVIKLAANAYQTFTLALPNGGLSQGDILVIDTENYEVTINGMLIFDGYEGEFFRLLAGEGEIVYFESSGAVQKNADFSVRFQEKFY